MKPLRILVVEDDAIIAMLFEELLAIMGHEVCGNVGTQSEAITSAAKSHPDLMIVDDRLSKGSGPGAMTEILSRGPMAHLFVTGNAARVKVAMPDSIVISKPFRSDELSAGIESAMRQGNLQPDR